MLCCARQCRPGATEQLPACQPTPREGPNYGQLRCPQLLALEAKAPRLVVVSEFSGRGLKLHSEEEKLRAGNAICGIKLLGGETHLVVRLTAPRTGALPGHCRRCVHRCHLLLPQPQLSPSLSSVCRQSSTRPRSPTRQEGALQTTI